MVEAIFIIWAVCIFLFIITFPIGIAFMAKEEWKLNVRRDCREKANEAMDRGDLKSAKKYINRSKNTS